MFVIVDNGSDRRGKAAIDRLDKAYPNAIMIHTPVHASWLNQIEIFFSIIQKRSSPRTTSQPGEAVRYLLAFVDRYNQTAQAVQLEVHRRDLTDLLRRIGEHEKPDPAGGNR